MMDAKQFEVEKFPEADLAGLREDLLRSGIDSWQAADMIRTYLSGRGYGVSSHAALHAAALLESAGYKVQHIQEQFEKIALVM